jgi:hypothetical protein
MQKKLCAVGKSLASQVTSEVVAVNRREEWTQATKLLDEQLIYKKDFFFLLNPNIYL